MITNCFHLTALHGSLESEQFSQAALDKVLACGFQTAEDLWFSHGNAYEYCLYIRNEGVQNFQKLEALSLFGEGQVLRLERLGKHGVYTLPLYSALMLILDPGTTPANLYNRWWSQSITIPQHTWEDAQNARPPETLPWLFNVMFQ